MCAYLSVGYSPPIQRDLVAAAVADAFVWLPRYFWKGSLQNGVRVQNTQLAFIPKARSVVRNTSLTRAAKHSFRFIQHIYICIHIQSYTYTRTQLYLALRFISSRILPAPTPDFHFFYSALSSSPEIILAWLSNFVTPFNAPPLPTMTRKFIRSHASVTIRNTNHRAPRIL